jgi:hypothetical protein
MDLTTDHVASLSIARVAIGATAWLAPRTALKGFLLDSSAPQAPYIMRLFAAREIALGGITLLAPPALKPALTKVGMAADSADAVAGALAAKAGEVRPWVGAVLTGAAVAAVVAGAVGLGQQK